MESDGLLTVRDGHLWFDGVDLAAAGRLETPFYVYSERRRRANAAALLDGFGARHQGTEVFFASKARFNLWFLHVVRDAGLNVVVNSGGELSKALRVGFAPRQIVFNGVAKTEAEIAAAVDAGVRAILADSLFELDRVALVSARLRKAAAVAPRVDVHVPALTHPGLETAHGGKAGSDRDDAVTAFQRAADDPWLTPVGLHLHVGSQITSVEPYRQAVETALDVVEEVEQAAGVQLEFLDAGGGFAVPYREPLAAGAAGAAGPGEARTDSFSSALVIDDYAAAICDVLEARRPDLTLFLEPGRSVATTCGVLVTRVENAKTKKLRGAGGDVTGAEDWLTIDAGFNTLLEHTNYAWYFPARWSRAEPASRPTSPSGSRGRSATAATCSPATTTRRTGASRPARAWATSSSSSRPVATRWR